MTSKSTDQKTGTTPGFTLCYKKDNILSISEIKQKRDMGCKFPLPVHQDYFDSNIKIPSSGGRISFTEKVSRRLQKGRNRLKDMFK